MLNKKILLIFGCVLLQISTCSFALQTKWVTDNGTVNASISRQDLTRIAVENDRILNVKGPDGEYLIKNDAIQGAIYIKPLTKPTQGLLTLFITTEQGGHYILSLTLDNKSSDAIVIKPTDAHNTIADHWEKGTPYIEEMATLVGDMESGEHPDGYAVNSVAGKPHQIGNMVTMTLISTYRGEHLAGHIYKLHNDLNQAITVSEREFYKPGDRAIALDNHILVPNGETRLYKVVNHG